MARNTHQILTDLESTGELKTLAKSGICQPCIFRNLEIYRFVDSRIKTGSKRMNAITETEVQFRVCRATVYNILKSFK